MSVQPMTAEIIELLHNHINETTRLTEVIERKDAQIAALVEQANRPCVHEATDAPTPFPSVTQSIPDREIG